VRLENDSNVRLRAVIRGADGSILGNVTLEPNTYPRSNYTWNDSSGQVGNNSSRSKTPLTVIWYCMNGTDFSISDNVSTGSFVRALQGSGKKNCTPNPKNEEETPPQIE
jgi:hypothetical protein